MSIGFSTQNFIIPNFVRNSVMLWMSRTIFRDVAFLDLMFSSAFLFWVTH